MSNSITTLIVAFRLHDWHRGAGGRTGRTHHAPAVGGAGVGSGDRGGGDLRQRRATGSPQRSSIPTA